MVKSGVPKVYSIYRLQRYRENPSLWLGIWSVFWRKLKHVQIQPSLKVGLKRNLVRQKLSDLSKGDEMMRQSAAATAYIFLL